MKKIDADGCEYCGGKLIERKVTLNLRIRGKLHEFLGVPAEVCVECGEKIFTAAVAKQLERLAQLPVKRRITVPVREYVPVDKAS